MATPTKPRAASRNGSPLHHYHDRITALEEGVVGLSRSIATFVTEAKDHRKQVEGEHSRLWETIKEQGVAMQRSIDKLSSRGEISWGKIVSTGGFLVALVGIAATMSNTLVEGRIKQVEIESRGYRELLEAKLEVERVRHVGRNSGYNAD